MTSVNFAAMLTELRVKNYALIKDLVFQPGQNFNVITGETGAGKSILLGAMGLILGERAETVTVKENEEKCIVEGYFNISGYELKQWFDENEFDYADNLILRREILLGGKSRAFINDTPAQLTQLRELGKYLIDIHSQHDNLDLLQKSFQFKVLDSFAGSDDLQKEYRQKFEELKNTQRVLAQLEEAEKRGSEERDYKQFLFDELAAADLVEGETSMLGEELHSLSNADSSLQTLGAVYDQLTESQPAVVDQLAAIRNQITTVAKNDKRFDNVLEKLNDAYYSLKDISVEIAQLMQITQADPERLEMVNQRLSLLHNLEKKHREENLITKRDSLEGELIKYANLNREIENCRIQKAETLEDCKKLAMGLSEKRSEQGVLLEKQVNAMITELGMSGAGIKVEITLNPDSELSIYGMNDTNFLFSPALGKLFNPIQNIASGGEMSRVMLVLKTILATKKVMPTIIFDEIDSGVSGEVALRMGDMLDALAQNMQLIAITHLPQIASKGKRHYFVYKKHINNSTVSDIRELSGEERIREIAEMMGGKAFGEATLESARQLLTH